MQNKLMTLTTVLAISLGATACIHKIDVEQGNIITQDMVNQLHPGMTSDQVQFIMGHPVLVETFENNRSDYVYTFQPGGKSITEKRVTLMFNDGRLTSINGTLHPELNPTTVTAPVPVNNDAVNPDTHTDTAPAAQAVGQENDDPAAQGGQ